MQFRKLLVPHVLSDEVLFRGGGIQREGEQFDVSVHVPVALIRALIRIARVARAWPWGKHGSKDHRYSRCLGRPSTPAATEVLSESP